MAGQSAGRVSLHPCFHLGLWSASVENTGEGGTPALFVSKTKETKERTNEQTDQRCRVRGVCWCDA